MFLRTTKFIRWLDDYENIEAFINEIALDGDFDIAGFDEDILKQMTRELNQVSKDIGDYGLIPDNYVKAQTPAETTASGRDVIPAQNNNAEPAQSNATPQTAQMAVKRSVICPSCGEVIYLD